MCKTEEKGDKKGTKGKGTETENYPESGTSGMLKLRYFLIRDDPVHVRTDLFNVGTRLCN